MNKFPISSPGQRITCGAASAWTLFSGTNQVERAASHDSLMIHNVGAVTVHVISGISTATPTATTSCMPIAPGEKRVFQKPQTHNGLACISSGANSDIVVFHGSGD